MFRAEWARGRHSDMRVDPDQAEPKWPWEAEIHKVGTGPLRGLEQQVECHFRDMVTETQKAV